jgi:hypothetical protein
VLKDSLLCRERVELATNKVMFWEAQNDDTDVQSGDVFETLLTEAPPQANAQKVSYKNWSYRILGEIEVSVAL